MNAPFDAILFDFDGVLADTEPIHYHCWREVLEPFGIELGWDRYAANCIGVADREMIKRLSREKTPPVDFDRLWAEYPRKKRIFRERVLAANPIQPAMVAFLHSLGGRKLAVVSSSGRSEVEPVLIQAGVWPLFSAAVFGKEVPRLKPAPDPYLRAAGLVGARNPLVVEDSDAGEASGRAAGFTVLRVSSAAEVPSRVAAALQRVGN